ALATSALEAVARASARSGHTPAAAAEFVNRGCSRGHWLPDGTKLGSVTYFEVTARPGSAASPTSPPEAAS
ncbi:MAG: hypothetical protein ACKOBS_00040, partial [Verrucomicrobiota bacterium]